MGVTIARKAFATSLAKQRSPRSSAFRVPLENLPIRRDLGFASHVPRDNFSLKKARKTANHVLQDLLQRKEEVYLARDVLQDFTSTHTVQHVARNAKQGASQTVLRVIRDVTSCEMACGTLIHFPQVTVRSVRQNLASSTGKKWVMNLLYLVVPLRPGKTWKYTLFFLPTRARTVHSTAKYAPLVRQQRLAVAHVIIALQAGMVSKAWTKIEDITRNFQNAFQLRRTSTQTKQGKHTPSIVPR